MALIEQKAAVSAISDLLMCQLKGERLPTYNEVYHAIHDLTPTDAVPVRHGRWILTGHLWECDKCGCRINRANPLEGNIWNYHFCPNCGSKMEVKHEAD